MSPQIGLTLRKARLARGLTVEQAARAVHIKAHYLRALEEERWEVLPSRAQGKGFLRLYADFLGLDAAALLQAWEAPQSAADAQEASSSAPSPVLQQPVKISKPDGEAQPARDEGGKASKQPLDPALPIFREIGRAFHQQREQLGLALEEVERYTHVKRHYLKAIEEGRLDDLPSPVQGRGMLLHYARFLQLDPEPLLLRFAEALQARHRQRQAPQRSQAVKVSSAWMRKAQTFFAERLLVWLVVLMLAVVGVGSWQVVRATRTQSAQPTPPNVMDVLFPSPTVSPTPVPPTATPTPPVPGLAPPGGEQPQAEGTGEPTEVPRSNAPIQVYFVAQHRAWVRVIADGETKFQGLVVPGASYNYTAQNRLEVLTGDGSALQVFYNQQDLGLLGRFGEVVDRIFTITGVQTPTPTVTPTPTITPTPTVTSTPTITPSPTATVGTLP